jgi:hypothetical protein
MPDGPAFRHLRKLYSGGTAYTLPVHTACVKRHPGVHTAGCGKKDTLHVHTAGGGKTPRMHVHTVGGGKTPSVSWMILASVNYKTWLRAEDRRIKILCIMNFTGSKDMHGLVVDGHPACPLIRFLLLLFNHLPPDITDDQELVKNTF